jgi:hypothetical protein
MLLTSSLDSASEQLLNLTGNQTAVNPGLPRNLGDFFTIGRPIIDAKICTRKGQIVGSRIVLHLSRLSNQTCQTLGNSVELSSEIRAVSNAGFLGRVEQAAGFSPTLSGHNCGRD